MQLNARALLILLMLVYALVGCANKPQKPSVTQQEPTATRLNGGRESGPHDPIAAYPNARSTKVTKLTGDSTSPFVIEKTTFETSDSYEQILTFYKQALIDAGWQSSNNFDTGGVGEGRYYVDMTYCPYSMLSIHIEEVETRHQVELKLHEVGCA
jgi:hypothetical protein